jgi:hypothetical protein
MSLISLIFRLYFVQVYGGTNHIHKAVKFSQKDCFLRQLFQVLHENVLYDPIRALLSVIRGLAVAALPWTLDL